MRTSGPCARRGEHPARGRRLQTDADLEALLGSTYHRDGGAGHALTYWRGRQALARELLAARQALRALLETSDLVGQLVGRGAAATLRQRLEGGLKQARACLPEHQDPAGGEAR